MRRIATLAGLALSTGACAGGGHPPRSVPVVTASDWRRVATPADRERIRNWRATWLSALKAANAADAGAIAREGKLFQIDHALSAPIPPPGNYRCRTFKLGARGTGAMNFVAYPFFDCRIADEGGVLSFYKTSGSQRPQGLIFLDAGFRGIFLGTLVLGDERSALQYGRDSSRDMAGIVERIGPRRWRLVLPQPRFESLLDVIELVPAD